jgi:hypothetical protein
VTFHYGRTENGANLTKEIFDTSIVVVIVGSVLLEIFSGFRQGSPQNFFENGFEKRPRLLAGDRRSSGLQDD